MSFNHLCLFCILFDFKVWCNGGSLWMAVWRKREQSLGFLINFVAFYLSTNISLFNRMIQKSFNNSFCVYLIECSQNRVYMYAPCLVIFFHPEIGWKGWGKWCNYTIIMLNKMTLHTYANWFSSVDVFLLRFSECRKRICDQFDLVIDDFQLILHYYLIWCRVRLCEMCSVSYRVVVCAPKMGDINLKNQPIAWYHCAYENVNVWKSFAHIHLQLLHLYFSVVCLIGLGYVAVFLGEIYIHAIATAADAFIIIINLYITMTFTFTFNFHGFDQSKKSVCERVSECVCSQKSCAM